MKIIQKDPTLESGDVGLRATLEGQGVTDITFDADKNRVSGYKGGQQVFYDASGLRNENGTLVGTQESINNLAANPYTGLRDTLTNKGYTNITYDPNTKGVLATRDGKTFYLNAADLANEDGTLRGTVSDIDNILANPLVGVRQTGNDAGIYVSVDANGNPTYNGQTLNTSGMVNIDGRWYASGDYLDNAVKAATNKYEDPYKGTRDKLLEKLLNYDEFAYNPKEDQYLQDAMELARRAAMRSAVDRGVGGSSIAEYASAAAANNLIPQYEDRAYQRYLGGRDYLGQLMGYVGDASDYALREYDITNENRKDDRNFAADREDSNSANKLTDASTAKTYADIENNKKLTEAQQMQLKASTAKIYADIENDKTMTDAQKMELLASVDKIYNDIATNNMSIWNDTNLTDAQVDQIYASIAYDKGILEVAKRDQALKEAAMAGYVTEDLAEITGLPEGSLTAEMIAMIAGSESLKYLSPAEILNWYLGVPFRTERNNTGGDSNESPAGDSTMLVELMGGSGYYRGMDGLYEAGGAALLSNYGDSAPVTTTTSGGGTATTTDNAGDGNNNVPVEPDTSAADSVFGTTFDWVE
jgi:hypothetical protein